MKKLILLLIVFVSSSVFSQINIDDNILGTWVSEQTPVELKVVKVKNDLEFIQHNTTTKSTHEEIVLRQLPDVINTITYIKETNWSLDTTYYLKDKHTLVANCFGSYYGTIYYTKIRQY
tara:strand:+ start:25 stop:381 length:357 start_codon:yes stop_codon:yes gene_type:complete